MRIGTRMTTRIRMTGNGVIGSNVGSCERRWNHRWQTIMQCYPEDRKETRMVSFGITLGGMNCKSHIISGATIRSMGINSSSPPRLHCVHCLALRDGSSASRRSFIWFGCSWVQAPLRFLAAAASRIFCLAFSLCICPANRLGLPRIASPIFLRVALLCRCSTLRFSPSLRPRLRMYCGERPGNINSSSLQGVYSKCVRRIAISCFVQRDHLVAGFISSSMRVHLAPAKSASRGRLPRRLRQLR